MVYRSLESSFQVDHHVGYCPVKQLGPPTEVQQVEDVAPSSQLPSLWNGALGALAQGEVGGRVVGG